MLTYANIQDRVEQMLQDTTSATYTTTITDMWIEEALKKAEFNKAFPHIVDVIFKIESRSGVDVTGTADTLTDLVKLQFVDLAAETGKVVHNTTDNTWSTIWSYASTSVYNITSDIMDANENYRIYNKKCWNQNQIYIGDVKDYLWIDSVEYPIGTKRNWKVYDDVLEIDVDSVDDSDSTLTNLGNIDVLIRFAKPHRLCKLTDLDGLVQTTAAALALSLQVYSFTDEEVARIGDEFVIGGHKQTYTTTAAKTFDDQATTGSTLTIYPGLEWSAIADRAVTFTQSTMKLQHEEVFIRLVTVIARLSEAEARHKQAVTDLSTGRAIVNTIPKGGPVVPGQYVEYARAELTVASQLLTRARTEYNDVLIDLQRITKPKTKHTWPKD